MDRRELAERRARQGNPLDYAVAQRDRDTLDMVRNAITHKEVLLAYQPVLKAADPQKPAFYEGLIRVLDETGRVIPAKDFLGSVANTETGRDLDCLALELGLQSLTENPTLRLSINMSARSIGYGRWMSTFEKGLRARPDVADRLILEIAETSAMQVPELVMDFMDRLQARGVTFALDDYASGLTSFKYFKDFFFDFLKVDGQFCRNIEDDWENRAIAKAITTLAHEFNIFTIATRVESIADARSLAHLGFDCLQGFALGPPTVSPPWIKNKNNPKAA
jgi:EAL domain-containing protein (putative c-di-GMP-specific phosphodiesterase class I)